jgi:hypothetical protein
LSTYQTLAELGSLAPLQMRSSYASSLLTRVWDAKTARFLLIAGGVLAILLLVFVGIALPFRQAVSLGFNPDGTPRDLIPSVQLILLPVMNISIYVADMLLGLFFYRRGELKDSGEWMRAGSHVDASSGAIANIGKEIAYLLWISAVITSLLFIGAFFFIVSAR